MKKSVVSFLAVAVLAAFLVSCVSMEYGRMTIQERIEANIVGTVSAEFTSFQPLHIHNRRQLIRRAHDALMRIAEQQFMGIIEIRNIRIEGSASPRIGLLYGIPFFAATAVALPFATSGDVILGLVIVPTPIIAPALLSGNFQRITVTGDVVLHEAGVSTPAAAVSAAQRIDGALNSAAGTLVNTIPQGSTVAILNVHSGDLSTAEFIMIGLEYRLFTSRRFVIVDRVRLDQIRHEQHLHISGEVDDASAVSIGHMLGASIVITGSVGDDAMGGWLVLRALDVQTGQVMAMAMQRF